MSAASPLVNPNPDPSLSMLTSLIKQVLPQVRIGGTPVSRFRGERMRDMVRLLQLPPGARIIDLGGSEYNWRLIDHDYHITMVNLPGFNPPVSANPEIYESIEADATDLMDRFGDNSFDAVFSNSVIEHVGPEAKQADFAREARRLAPAYWVQTPSLHFPIEAHNGLLYFWRRSQASRDRIYDRWSKKYPAWVEMLRETRVLSEARMKELFPDGQLYKEHRFGFEKSLTMYRPYPAA